jgi:hypothetical protein
MVGLQALNIRVMTAETSTKRVFNGGLAVAVEAPPFVCEAFDLLFGAFPREKTGESIREELRIRVFPADGCGWAVDFDGLRAATLERLESVPPMLESAVSQFLVHHRADRIAIHAAAVASPSGALLMPGEKGSGKSTLSLWLTRCGHTFLGDDVVWIDPVTTTVEAHPKAAAIKAGAFRLFDEVDTYESHTRGPLRYFAPARRPIDLEAKYEVERIWFPRHSTDAECGNYPLHPEETLLYLAMMLCGDLRLHPERFAAVVRLAQKPAALIVYRDVRDVEAWLRGEGAR